MNYHELTPQDRDRIERWKETLECSEDEMLAKLLDAYCQTRSPLPGKNLQGDDLVPEPKTTTEICDDLMEMEDTICTSFVYDYMETHGYGFVTTEDGKLRWAIWRDMSPLQVESCAGQSGETCRRCRWIADSNDAVCTP